MNNNNNNNCNNDNTNVIYAMELHNEPNIETWNCSYYIMYIGTTVETDMYVTSDYRL
jgi:hypothetical protein